MVSFRKRQKTRLNKRRLAGKYRSKIIERDFFLGMDFSKSSSPSLLEKFPARSWMDICGGPIRFSRYEGPFVRTGRRRKIKARIELNKYKNR